MTETGGPASLTAFGYPSRLSGRGITCPSCPANLTLILATATGQARAGQRA